MRHPIAALFLVALVATAPAAQEARPVDLDALISCARGALAARQPGRANQCAEQAYAVAASALKDAAPADAPRLSAALASAIELRASAMVGDNARAEAVRFLKTEIETRGAPIAATLEAALGRITLEGRPAPALDTRLRAGPRGPAFGGPGGRVVLLFFWAHWCVQCRADAPVVERLIGKYGSQGLVVVAPTRRYGYVEEGKPAPPARELRHIIQVRDTHYAFLRDRPVPIGEANHDAYGVTTIPMYVLVDRKGIVRLYHAGRIAEAELESAVRSLL
jgi:thiol-disulfide isomerase/thioredoxin